MRGQPGPATPPAPASAPTKAAACSVCGGLGWMESVVLVGWVYEASIKRTVKPGVAEETSRSSRFIAYTTRRRAAATAHTPTHPTHLAPPAIWVNRSHRSLNLTAPSPHPRPQQVASHVHVKSGRWGARFTLGRSC